MSSRRRFTRMRRSPISSSTTSTTLFYLLTHLENFLAMQALRPLALSATLDLLLAHPQWRDRVDAAQIGGFGASMGGESLLLMAGAGLTTSIGQSWTRITNDARLKAAVGYVPYFGQPGLPAFGRGQHGLDGVTLPFSPSAARPTRPRRSPWRWKALPASPARASSWRSPA